MISLIIFNGIYRIQDNTALVQALRQSEKVVPVFILHPCYKNKLHHRNFLFNIMKSIHKEFAKYDIQLYCFSLDISSIIKNIYDIVPIKSIFINKTYTYPESLFEKSLELICNKYVIELNILNDILLINIDKPLCYDSYIDTYYIKTSVNIENPNTYTLYDLINIYINVFSNTKYIFNKCIDIEHTNYKYEFNISGKIWNDYIDINGDEYKYKFKNMLIKGTREDAIDILNSQSINTTVDYYNLIPYIRHGVISSREVFHKIVKQQYTRSTLNISNSPIMQYLLKRDHIYNLNKFDTNRIYNNQNILTLPTISIDTFINANTGIPIIDACIRQLAIEGYTDPKIKFILYRYYKIYVIKTDNKPSSQFSNNIDYDELIDREMWNSIIDTTSNYLDVVSYINRYNLKYTINKWLLHNEFNKFYNKII